MFGVEPCSVPDGSLLAGYRDRGAYTDSFTTNAPDQVTQSDYIYAFYTSFPFKIERQILRWVVAKPSTDDDARSLADARSDTFAAWDVESRRDNQILLSDYRGRTRSWLMSDSNRLYFGSAVIPRRRGKSLGLLLRFHSLYSQVLLSSAREKLSIPNRKF